MKILVMRHGKNSRDEYGIDIGLAPEGVEQVKIAVKSLKDLTIADAYVSPALRACQTAIIVREEIGLLFSSERDFRDIEIRQTYFQARHYINMPLKQVKQSWIDGGPGFESPNDFLNRVKKLIAQILKWHIDNQTVLIVAHEETVWALMTIISKVPFAEAIETEVKYASIVEFNIAVNALI